MKSWIFTHEGRPCFIEEQEARSSCFFRDYVMGRVECRRITGQVGESIETHAALRYRKQARIAAINTSGGAIDLAQALIRDRLLSEVEAINAEILELMKKLPIDAEPHEIAREAWRERVEAQRNATILSLANDVRETSALIAKLHMEQTSETSEAERAKIREAYSRERLLVARLVAQAKSKPPEVPLLASAEDEKV